MKITGRIIIADSLMRELNIPFHKYIMVRSGSLKVYTELVVSNKLSGNYELSSDLAQRLNIHSRKKLLIRYDHLFDMLHLGPTIGILTTALRNESEYEPTSLQAELIFLSKIANTLPGQIYIFTPSSINWSNLTTRGYYYRQTTADRGIWLSAIFPLPDVVYDRVSTRKGELRTQIRDAKHQLMSMENIKYFNPSFLNKWKVHQIMMTNPELHQYLPETRELTQDIFEHMLIKYPVLYLKPGNGSLGMGIIRVSSESNGGLKYVVHRRKRIRGQAESAKQLMSKTKAYRSDRPYIVQQGIALATFRGRPFDLRIIFQKNGQGKWQISKKFVRLAPPGSSVANLSSGGSVETSRKVMNALFKNKEIIEKKNQEIYNFCLTLANTLELSSGQIFGELGLDIGIDKHGELWLIEVNSKPRKTTETGFSKIIMKNTFKRPLEYSTYLAGF